MGRAQKYERTPNGMRLDFKGMNTIMPSDILPPGKFPYAQNVRRYQKEAVFGRSLQTAPNLALGPPINSTRRMNDSTPAGPPSGYVIVSGAGVFLYADTVQVNSSLSGKKISIVPFRPNQSVQPWAYIADDHVMLKVRSDGLCYKMGIREPEFPPGATFPGGGTGISPITYRYTYRSSATGAVSNPSPASFPGTNATDNVTEAYTAGDHSSNVTFNASQWSAVGTQLRTTGGATSSPALLSPVIGHDFGFTIPTTEVIIGIVVDLTWQNQPTEPPGLLQTVSLYYQGNVIGNSITPGVASTDVASDFIGGSSGDTWGVSTLTPDIVNNPTFGFGVSIFENKGRIFINGFSITVYTSSQDALVSVLATSDPQVDKIDIYRLGAGLESYTYVGTTDNVDVTFNDTLADLNALANPLLEFDNFEPFVSIDLPRAGVLNAAAGMATYVSGDLFNMRWLPGTIIVIGHPIGIAYTLDRRPYSTTAMFVSSDMPDGVNLPWTISQPPLAAQPMRSMWGPTDNVAFMFAVGDPLRPGTLYFTKGNNPDSAPDTNQIEVTSPSEPLMGGCIVNGLGLVFSTERAWLCYPNFFNALATVTGTIGSAFTLVLSISNRGLYAKNGICTDGGANAFFVGKDGIYMSPNGQGSRSITDEDLYNLFPHEGEVQSDLVIGTTGLVVYAPDYTNPDAMELSFANGYLYYDYQDKNGNPRTLVYDLYAQGWVVDVYQFPATTHATEEGNVDGVLVGCMDGTIRQLTNTGIEAQSSILLTTAMNGGDARAFKDWGDIWLEAKIDLATTVTIFPFTNFYNNAIPGVLPVSITTVGGPTPIRAPYILDFANGEGFSAVDFEAMITWSTDANVGIYTWQPNLIPTPEYVLNRPTDWDDAGSPQAKFVQGMLIEADTFTLAKNFAVQSSDDLSLHFPNEVPVIFNGQSIKAFTFTPPFVAHSVRLISTDSVAWRTWEIQWVVEPYPESTIEWQTEGLSFGGRGWQHIYLINIGHSSLSDLTLTATFDQWPTIVETIPNSVGVQTKTKIFLGPNKFKIASFRLSSDLPFTPFEEDMEFWIKDWGSAGEYRVVKPFGGKTAMGARV